MLTAQKFDQRYIFVFLFIYFNIIIEILYDIFRITVMSLYSWLIIGNFTKILGISGDRGKTETAGTRHKLLHRLPATTANYSKSHFRCAADLHSHGAARW